MDAPRGATQPTETACQAVITLRFARIVRFNLRKKLPICPTRETMRPSFARVVCSFQDSISERERERINSRLEIECLQMG